MEIECKHRREEVKVTEKGREGKRLREGPLDKGSTVSVARMTMTPLCDERVKDATIAQGSRYRTIDGEEGTEDVRQCDINGRFLSRFLFLYA